MRHQLVFILLAMGTFLFSTFSSRQYSVWVGKNRIFRKKKNFLRSVFFFKLRSDFLFIIELLVFCLYFNLIIRTSVAQGYMLFYTICLKTCS